MASSRLAAHHSEDFHIVLNACLERYVQDVCRIYERAILPACAYEFPESTPGACDGQPCSEKGTVHDLTTDQAYCAKHFRAVQG